MLLNAASLSICRSILAEQLELRIQSHRCSSGATVLDFGVNVTGGIEAGLLLAKICLGAAAEVELTGADRSIWNSPQVMVRTDLPLQACMASQYAGWPIQRDKFFAMGSGPMRCKRGKEHVLESLSLVDEGDQAVGVLECDKLPSSDVCEMIAEECGVAADHLTLCVAPTRSLAGTLQVVARSVETCLHKLFELGFDLRSVQSGVGTAPLPPPARDFAEGIGRTNDAILYGGLVTLWVDCDDNEVEKVIDRVPSQSSSDWGQPFAQIFNKYNFDFYKVDPGLFSPAEVTLCNLRSGRSWHVGQIRPDVLKESFSKNA